eukprot:COSAG02_NODE_187_length_30377_cov_3.636271_15_plen_49_part_00
MLFDVFTPSRVAALNCGLRFVLEFRRVLNLWIAHGGIGTPDLWVSASD